MHRSVPALCIVALLCGCAADDGPQWSNCQDARAAATFFEVPPVELADPVEVGDELPVLRWGSGVSDSEGLATQALALACLLTNDDVRARPALLDWAQAEVEGMPIVGDHQVFDRDLMVSLRRSGPRAALSVARDVASEPPLDVATREVHARALVDSLFEQGAVEGASIDDVSLVYLNTTIAGPDGAGETVSTLASVVWRPRLGRAQLGLDSVEARIDDNGHASSITVPLARLYDEGERVTAEVAESEAGALFVQKAEAGLTLEGWTVENPTGQLSVPVREAAEIAELMWLGTYVAVSGDGRVGRRTPYFMSMSDPEAPLTNL
ncbi:MAG: hypothetical protein KUG77_20180 [Nannocystaceae bacterium]|nr:hypothetical protein [Nannocystaceae bacterium]